MPPGDLRGLGRHVGLMLPCGEDTFLGPVRPDGDPYDAQASWTAADVFAFAAAAIDAHILPAAFEEDADVGTCFGLASGISIVVEVHEPIPVGECRQRYRLADFHD